ncbi:DNA damage-binding protein 1 [Galendromus occidentalis]|uniref:DNA damage-binding protein 1 n=1 Tax=Galendromus occidentalis TaxID=34638 RepID=A0AAJ7SFR0_9ACAR|nr:DNA damage-binding protein 1 [Galendromus occidentalis]
MSYNYIVTAHKPTAVTGCLTGNFTTPTDRNLIVAKNTRLEILTITEEGLKPIKEVNIYGRISVMKKFRYPNESKDLLFFLTDKYNVAILEFSAESSENFEVITRSHGCVSDPYARPSEAGNLVVVDQPKARVIALRLYDGLLKMIPLNREAKELRSYNIRVEEAQITDMCFLSSSSSDPVLAIVYEEQQTRHMKTHVIALRDKELMKGPWGQRNLDLEADMLIPVEDTETGVIIVGGETIVYHYGQDYICIQPSFLRTTKISCYCRIDNNRFILGGICGRLFILTLRRENKKVVSHSLDLLGSVSIPECLSYLDNGVVFVGSRLGDSQLIRMHAQEPFIEVLESYTNLGAILDMIVVDLEKQGQDQLITCSGQGACGSLRIIRNGIGIHELACVELSGIKGIWALRMNTAQLEEDTPTDDTLVLSFVGQTRVFNCSSTEELEQVTLPAAFDIDSQTFCARNVLGNQVIQVTDKRVNLISVTSKTRVDQWFPPEGEIITQCACNDVQVALALKNVLVYLEIRDGSLTEIKRTRLEYEIACMDLNTLDKEGDQTSIITVGLWTDVSILVLSLPDLEQLFRQELPKDVIPRSVLKITFEGSTDYLLCTLADGSLFYYHLASTGELTGQKRVTLGTQPTTLRKFRSQRTWSVFACSDRPTVIYSSTSKLVFSKVNLREVKHMCSFSSEAFPDSLALASEDEFVIGTIDAIQKLHIRTVPLGESPRRIAYQEETGTFGVIVSRSDMACSTRCASLDAPNKSNASPYAWHKDFSSFGHTQCADRVDSGIPSCSSTSLQRPPSGCDETFSLLIIDQNTFEVLHAMQFCPNEYGVSICSAKLGSDPNPYYIVGTAFINQEESEPKVGRIFVLRWHDGKLETIAEKEAAGAPYSIREFHQKLAIAINSTVRLYSWNAEKDLQSECTPFFNIVILHLKCLGDYILVGDLMRSMTLLNYNADITSLEEIGRDYQTNWTTAVEILDEDTFLAAESNLNLYVCKRDPSAADDTRQHMHEVALYHLGEMVNVIVKGSLVMAQPGDMPLPLNKSFLYGSLHGAVGVIVPIKQELYAILNQIQTNLAKTIKSVGKIEHGFWRTFLAERKIEPATGFIDGDLIEQLLDLPKEALESVSQSIKVDEEGGHQRNMTPEDLVKLVEDLTRIH